MAEENETLADDMLYGAQEITNYTRLTVRQVYHQQKNLGLKHLGAMLVGSSPSLGDACQYADRLPKIRSSVGRNFKPTAAAPAA